MSLPAEQLHQQSLDILAKLASLHKNEEHIETSHLALLTASPPCPVTCPFCGQTECNRNCNRSRKENPANMITGGNVVDNSYMVSVGKNTAQVCCNNAGNIATDSTTSKKQNILTTTPQKNVLTTPQKKESAVIEPMTPEANLKMLVSAASGLEPAIPKSKRELETLLPNPSCTSEPALRKSLEAGQPAITEPVIAIEPPPSVSTSTINSALLDSLICTQERRPSKTSSGSAVSTSTKVLPSKVDHVLETINMMPVLPKALSCLGRTLLPKDDPGVLYDADGENTEDSADPKTKTEKLTGRKEKSLGLLCKKFMSIYPEFSPEGTVIMLDDVVTSLSIGRRRVYDIVNVLESMEMMVRQAKNKYLWFGKSRLPDTLAKLKALALRVYGINFSHMAKRVCGPNVKAKPGDKVPNTCYILPKNAENVLPSKMKIETNTNTLNPNSIDTNSKNRIIGPITPELQNNPNNLRVDDFTHLMMDSIISYDMGCRDGNRSLGILCQKFIMLFMVAENNVVSLDRAAKLLITEPEEGAGKYKTKVRRLYDIANILTSIGFLEKCVSFEERSKKAAYKWIGIDLKAINCEQDAGKAFLSQEFSLTRHSLLTQGVRDCYDVFGNPKSRTRVLGTRSSSAQNLSTSTKSAAAQNMPGQVRKCNLRTMSDTIVFADKENADPKKQDGFEIDSLETENKIKPLATVNEHITDNTSKAPTESPNQSLFKEKLRLLQQEFPDKLSGESLADLVSFIKANPPPKIENSPVPSPAPSPAPSRRRLSSELDSQSNERMTKKVKPEPLGKSCAMNNILSPVGNPVNSPVPLSLFAASNTTNVKSRSEIPRSSTKLQPPTFMTIPAMVKPVATADSKAAQNISMLLSPIANPMSLPKSGLYQIIPVQCRPALVERQRETSITPSPFTPSPVNKGKIMATPSPGSKGTLFAKASPKPATEASKVLEKAGLMRQAATTVSPSVAISPTPASLKQFTDSPINQHQLTTENYQGFFTPPHVVQKSAIKPPANPISFPKMTPETPTSLGLSRAVLTNVTRKLSLQREKSM